MKLYNKVDKPAADGASKRQLRVGEDLRHLLAGIFIRQEVYHPDLDNVSITITCVEVSGNLRNAKVFVVPLSVPDPNTVKKIIKILNELAKKIRHVLAPQLTCKYVPTCWFVHDTSFAYGAKIDALLNSQSN